MNTAMPNMSELTTAAVKKAVAAQINDRAKALAADAVERLLTPEALAEMKATAETEAEAALDGRPDPDADAEPAEQKPVNRYSDEREFAEQYLFMLYRRDVQSSTGESENGWCPRWYDHGEVLARVTALHRSWESAVAAGSDLADWWVRLCDPMMDRIFDPRGTFKFCTHKRHSEKLQRMPLEGAAELFPSEDEQLAAAAAEAGLVLPQGAGRTREPRVRLEFP